MYRYISPLLVVVLVGSSSVTGHEGATGIVKERMDAMSEMGDSTKLIAEMLKGERTLDADVMKAAVDLLVSHGDEMASWFPDTEQSRTGHKTEALPEIWENFDEFESQSEDMTEKARDLRMVLEQSASVSEIKKSFGDLAKTCKACHKDFRQP